MFSQSFKVVIQVAIQFGARFSPRRNERRITERSNDICSAEQAVFNDMLWSNPENFSVDLLVQDSLNRLRVRG